MTTDPSNPPTEKMPMNDRYMAAAHAMQTGVAMDQARKPENTKHLRVGINSAMVNDAAIARLLISKGIITEEEYVGAVTEEMEAEAKRYADRLSEELGTRITLG